MPLDAQRGEGLAAPEDDFITGPERAKCILSGPGTGKTSRLMELTERLLHQGVPPSEIVVLAFTRAAVKEFRDRVLTDLGIEEEECPDIRTLHSFSLMQILRHNPFSDVPDPLFVADDYEEDRILLEELCSALSWRKRELREVIKEYQDAWHTLDVDAPDWNEERRRGQFMSELQRLRRDYHFVLRGELVYLLKATLDAHPALRPVVAPTHLIVDEYQDLNKCDQAVVQHMFGAGSILAIAGDDDQTIYEGLRKADPEGIRNFETDYLDGRIYRLTGCHRCPKRILMYSNRLILQNQRRVPKVVESLREDVEGEVYALEFGDQNEEARSVARICEYLIHSRGVQPFEILILLSRKGGFAKHYLDLLLGRSLPARLFTYEAPFLNDKQVRRAFALMRFAVQQEDTLAARTWLETTPNLGSATLNHFRSWRNSSNISFAEAIRRISSRNSYDTLWMRRIGESFLELTEKANELNSVESLQDKANLISSLHTPPNEEYSQFLETLAVMSAQENGFGLSDMIAEIREMQLQKDLKLDESSIRVMTMHSAKGLSARAVIIPGLEDVLIPGAADPLELEEKRRLLYVSMTRSKELLYLTHCIRRGGSQAYLGNGRGRSRRRRSRFLEDMRIGSVSGSDFLSSLF